MIAVERSRSDVVEPVVIIPGKPVGAVGIGPDPGLEGRLDLCELLLGRLGVDHIEDALFAVALPHGIEDLRHPAVERVGKQLAGVPPIRAPFRGPRGGIPELSCLDRPGGEFGHVADLDFGAHHLPDEIDNVGGGNPGGTQSRRDIGRAEVGRLDVTQRPDIAFKHRIECSGGFRGLELVAHLAREIGVGGLPGPGLGFAENGVTQLGDDGVHIGMHELGNVIDIDMTALVEHHGQRIGGTGDDRRRGRSDHPLGEDRTGARRVRLEVVILDRGDEPAIGVVEEGLEIGAAVRLADFAGLKILLHRYGRGIDRTEGAHEVRPGDAQPDLVLLEGLIELLSLEDLAHGVADRDQLSDDPGLFVGDAFCGTALAHRDGDGFTVAHLHQRLVLADKEAALADALPIGLIEFVGIACIGFRIDGFGLTVIDRFRKKTGGGAKRLLQIDTSLRQAGIGLAERSGRRGMDSQHVIRMLREPAIDPDGALVLGCRPDLFCFQPGHVALGVVWPALPEIEDVGHHIRAGLGPETALRQAEGGDKVGLSGDRFPRGWIGLVHGAAGGDESRKPAGLQPVDRLDDEIVMQPQTEAAIGLVRAHRAVGKGWIADRQVEMRGQIHTGEIAVDDPGAGLEQAGDPRCDRVELDTSDMGDRAQVLGHQGGKQPCADAGFEHPTAAPAKPQQARPDGPDDELRREMRILRTAGKRSVFLH